MISSLNEEQIKLLSVYRDKWIDIGLSTEPLDFENAKLSLIEAYKVANLSPPEQFLMADSPNHAIKLIKEIDPNLSKIQTINSTIYGAHDAHWLAFYEYMRDVLNIAECNKLNGLINLAKYSGWVNAYEKFAIIQHRPIKISFDDQKRTHCEDGPAIEYRDGFSVYCWHGVRIPENWIKDKKSLTPTMALTWANIEQRRCACEILTWNVILQELNSKIIDENFDPQIGTLLEVDIPDIGTEKFLQVVCGTGRKFAIPVPPEMKTAMDANAWTYGFTNEEFIKPEIRT